MWRRIFPLITAAVLLVSGTSAYGYGYPITDPFLATVAGTPEPLRAKRPQRFPIKNRTLDRISETKIPDVLWYQEKFRYSLVRQKGPAPLIFCIAGTGGYHNTGKNAVLMPALYQAGFHVVGLTSPTHPNFIASASSTGVPGHLYQDTEDLYLVMQGIWQAIKDDVEVTEFYLTGYSLGGTHAAFVARIDKQHGAFNFKKVMMINPSVKLYNSVSILDRMLENIPGGIDNLERYFSELVKKLTRVYKRSDVIEFNEDFLYKVFQEDPPTDEQLASLIGVAFRLASANLTFTSDVMTNYGFVKPRNEILTTTTSLDDYFAVSLRVGFTDYFHEYFYPYFHAEDATLTREGLSKLMSLHSIEKFLRSADNVSVMHNADDIILATGEIGYLKKVFGKRAKIYPHGGHLGNLEYRENMSFLINFFKQ